MSETAKEQRLDQAEATEGKLRWANFGGVLFAFLQSICAAVLAISGFRVLIGLGSLAAASGVMTSLEFFHQDAIRVPMMVLALGSAGKFIFGLESSILACTTGSTVESTAGVS